MALLVGRDGRFPRDDQVSTSPRGRDATVTAPRATRGRFGELVNSGVLLGSMTIWDATEESDLDRALVIEAAAEIPQALSRRGQAAPIGIASNHGQYITGDLTRKPAHVAVLVNRG
jgi:hypothetical protein